MHNPRIVNNSGCLAIKFLIFSLISFNFSISHSPFVFQYYYVSNYIIKTLYKKSAPILTCLFAGAKRVCGFCLSKTPPLSAGKPLPSREGMRKFVVLPPFVREGWVGDSLILSQILFVEFYTHLLYYCQFHYSKIVRL